MGEEKILRSIDYDSRRTLSHIGVLERSGRYPWGSGEHPFQRLKDWKGYVANLRRNGMSDEDIAKSSGMTLEEFHDSLVSTTVSRGKVTIRNAQERIENVAHAWELKNKGYSNVAIAEAMGTTESNIRNWLKPGADERARQVLAVSDTFRDAVNERGIIDCGAGVQMYLGVSQTRMNACLELLKDEGYHIYTATVRQAGTGKETTIRALCPPEMTYQEFREKYNADPSIVKPVGFYAEERGGEIKPIGKPTSISRDRIMVRFGEEGGSQKDGVIELRPGVEDLDLLGTKYAQVRIGVDDKMYMKGMAIYGDPKDFPKGVDVIYNVNRPAGSPDLPEGDKEGIFKKMYKKGAEDPFGATTSLKGIDEETGDIVYQKTYIGSDGKQHQSALNIVNDQGSWDEWSPSLASQFLSKQKPELAKKQLAVAAQSKQDEFDEIMSLTNPTVKKKMLEEYADNCDSAAVHLKAAALPRQRTQVLLPINSLGEKEIYAPNFRDGETVVLVRYPHAGTFESPELTVNNKNKDGIRIIGKNSTDTGGRALDAVGINSKTAAQLSGADFDGDSVIVLPNNDGSIRTRKYLKELQNFDPKIYALPADDKAFTLEGDALKKYNAKREQTKQREMGIVSNLITDMTIKGAGDSEIARAVKHSMVVIDCVKHNLDWKASYKENGIQELKNKWQAKDEEGKPGGGSSTIISRAKSKEYVNERKLVYTKKVMSDEEEKIYNEHQAWKKEVQSLKKKGISEKEIASQYGMTVAKLNAELKTDKVVGLTKAEKAAYDKGEVIYRETARTMIKKNKNGEWVDTGKLAQQTSTKMKEAKDARSLSSGTVIEEIYADYANKMKSLANQARAASRTTPPLEYSPSAEKTYSAEVDSLRAKLQKAEMNRPVERQAQLVASAAIKAKIAANPELKEDKDALKKENNKALTLARTMTGANKSAVAVKITDREWEAIQAGAIRNSMLEDILKNTDMDAVKRRATPRASTGLTESQASRARAMAANGLSQAEIADALGVSTSTINKVLNG